MTDHTLTGKTVLIAGGAKNLGGLIARDFARHGASHRHSLQQCRHATGR